VLTSNGRLLKYSSYIGGTNDDYVQDITTDTAGDIYLVGMSQSSDFPTTPGVFQEKYPTGVWDRSGFIAKIDHLTGQLVWGTYIGGTVCTWLFRVRVLNEGFILVCGSTISPDYPTTAKVNLSPLSSIADWNTKIVVTMLSKDASALIFSDISNGSSNDSGLDFKIRNGLLYITGSTASSNFPTSSGCYQSQLHGAYDAFVSVYRMEDLMTSVEPEKTGITDITPVVNVWPNPVGGGGCRLSGTTGKYLEPVTIRVVDIRGREVWRTTTESSATGSFSAIVDTSTLPPGMYLYSISSARRLFQGKFIRALTGE
jgi:hypothetical protein